MLAHDDNFPAVEGARNGASTVSEERKVGGERKISDTWGFHQLRAVWVRPWPDKDDHEAAEAYAHACREVGHAAVLEAAKRWVEAADAPRFLPKLSRWLADRCWQRHPLQHKKHREARGRYRKREKVDMSALALKLGGYVEDENGSLVWGGIQ